MRKAWFVAVIVVLVSPLLLWSFAGQLEEVVLVNNRHTQLCCFLPDVLLAVDCCLITLGELFRAERPGGLVVTFKH